MAFIQPTRRALLTLAATVALVAVPAAQDAAEPNPSDLALSDPAPPIGKRVDRAITEGVKWLVEHQRENGAWGSHHSSRPIEVLCGVPGGHQAFRVTTTGLCVMALMDSGVKSDEVRGAIDRGIDLILEEYGVGRQSGLEHYNVWAYGYSLHCFGEFLDRRPDDERAQKIRDACAHLMVKLERHRCLDGGWGYLSLEAHPTYPQSFTSMSFTTATALVGIERAQRHGIEVPQKLLDRAVASVQRCKTPLGAYTYGEIWNRRPASEINLPTGAACRTPACLYAVDLHGEEVPLDEYERSLEWLLVKHRRFQIFGLRRPIPHESAYAISGYFYLYGHAYASYVLELLSEEKQRRLSPLLAEAVLETRQPDGSFWDYPLYSYHKPYGTAYALIALSRLTLDSE